jgi:PadR family transcriptional regulator, regulatory protein PadR
VAKERDEILQGTLDMLALKALQLEPMHGWGITERLEQWSRSVLQVGQGTIYPALYRLERQGLVRSEWQVTENNRRARSGSAWSIPSPMSPSCRRCWPLGSAVTLRLARGYAGGAAWHPARGAAG